jgi:hypothetical protein
MYKPYSSIGMVGSIFSIGLNTYTELAREVLDLVDGEQIKLLDIDMMFILVNQGKKSEFIPANGLVRYQFLEILLRLSLKKYPINSFNKESASV